MMISTAHHLWSMDDVLGQGATANVYKARNKKSGEVVAVKVFNTLSYNRPYEVQMREFEMLRKLNHVNIVKLHTVEEMQMNPNQKVLVMEYCAGGSLLNLLEEPENAFGLSEQEFLTMMQCVVHGTNHLREKGVVHRDIKPGNIMRQVGEDGRSVYKLTDFGAARELEDDEKFVSIYGTEEYLHPDMYERAVLRKPHQKTYGVTVDLWSIGVTFYHAATGGLPFVPHGGPRRNKQIMHKITTEKPPKAISGIQKVEDGPIEWSYALPQSCQLTEGLKGQLVPVLASTLEASQERCWGFDQFFAATTDILHRVAVHVFSLQQASAYCIYINFHNTASIFFEEVQAQTGVGPDCQQYLFQGHVLLLEPTLKVVNLPPTSPEQPIFLLSRRPEKIVGLLPGEPDHPVMTNRYDVMADYTFSKAIVGVVHQYLRIGRVALRSKQQILQGFYGYIENIRTECNSTAHKLAMVNMKLLSCLNIEERLHSLQFPLQFPEMADNQRRLRMIQENLPVYASGIRDFQSKLNHLQLELSKLSEALAEDKSIQKTEVLLGKIVSVHQQYRKDRLKGKLSYNDEQIHKFEKINLSGNIKRVKFLFREDCLQKYHNVLATVENWSCVLYNIQTRLKDCSSCFLQLMGDLQMCEERQGKALDGICDKVLQSSTAAEQLDAQKNKDHMILRMTRLREEMETMALELQNNNSMIESLGAIGPSVVPGTKPSQPSNASQGL